MKIKIISKPGCPACVEAKAALMVRGLDFEEDVRDTQRGLDKFIAEGHRSFPRVFIDDKLIGGNFELQQWLKPKSDDNDF